MRVLLYVGFVFIAAVSSALLAEANRWGASATTSCDDVRRPMSVAGQCLASGSPGWVVAVAAVCGAAVAAALALISAKVATGRRSRSAPIVR